MASQQSLIKGICGGVLIMSQGLMGVFTAILLRSGHYICTWWLLSAKCFHCSLPFPPQKGKYVRLHWLAV